MHPKEIWVNNRKHIILGCTYSEFKRKDDETQFGLLKKYYRQVCDRSAKFTKTVFRRFKHRLSMIEFDDSELKRKELLDWIIVVSDKL